MLLQITTLCASIGALPHAAPQDLASLRCTEQDTSARTTLRYCEHDDALWVRGRSYKAAAAPDGFTFVPFLGSDAPRTWPTTFRLRGATLAGTALNLTGAAEVSRDGDRFVLDRGPVDVTYDLTPESVEQSFHVDAAGAAGDLVLTLDVESDLVASPENGGFRFAGPGGGFTYGAAIVLDGAGRRAAVPATFEAGALQLTVPADFLAVAEGPVVVDPRLFGYSIDQGLTDLMDPDVTWKSNFEKHVYVYEEVFAANDTDISFSRVDLFGVVSDSGYFDLTTEDCVDPEIATVNWNHLTLTVYTRIDTNGDGEIHGRVYRVGSQTVDPEISIANTTPSYSDRRPDVGGNGTTNVDGQFYICWIRDLASGPVARGRTFDVDGVFGTVQLLSSDTSDPVEEVVVSKSVGRQSVANYWNVAYRSENPTTNDVTIHGAQIEWDGTPRYFGDTLLALPSGVDALDLDVSDAIEDNGADGTYVVTYARQTGVDSDVWIMSCRDNARLANLNLHYFEHAEIDGNRVLPRIATTKDEFLVSYLEEQEGTFNRNAYATQFHLQGGVFPVLDGRRDDFGDTGLFWSGGCALGSAFAGGDLQGFTMSVALATWGPNLGVSSWNIDGGHTIVHRDSCGIQYCYGEPNSTGDRGFLHIEGTRDVTSIKRLRAGGLPTNSIGLFAMGTLPVSIPNVAGSPGTLCVGGVLTRFLTLLNTGTSGKVFLDVDPTALPVIGGTAPAMAGEARGFQFWHRDSVGGTATFNFTNAATIVFQ